MTVIGSAGWCADAEEQPAADSHRMPEATAAGRKAPNHGAPDHGAPGHAPPDPRTAARTLLELHRTGRLAQCWPELPSLLADLPESETGRAGRLLAGVDPQAVTAAHPGLPVVSFAITGHGTLSGLTPALVHECARHGLVPRITVSPFGSYVAELSDPGSVLHRSAPDLVLCVLDPHVVLDELPLPWRPPDVEAVLAEKTALLDRLAERYARTGTGALVLNTLPLPRALAAQLVDHCSRAALGAIWREANARLLRMAATRPDLVVLDLEPLIGEGVKATEARMSVYAKAHLSTELLVRYAREAGHLARHLTGRTKKCLAVDLDQTLWGGVLGEDGPDGVEVGDTPRGEAFAAFQRVVRQLGSQGVLLAAISKNDPEAVREVFARRTGMPLREADFVRLAANWRPKHDNLNELAQDLRLTVDSLVFADDSPYECGLVRRELPGVAVVPLDAEPAQHIGKLLADGWFDTRELTAEDRRRPALYRSDGERADFLRTFDSLRDYLVALRISVHIAAAADPDIGRISQLTLRTNQFHLATTRLSPAEVRALVGRPGARVLTVRAADRFGDSGLVGAVFTTRIGEVLRIDNFLLSCRVFSRGIEQAALAAVLRQARAEGARAVVGVHRPGRRNRTVRDFYPRHGFVPESGPAGAGPAAAPDGPAGAGTSPSGTGELPDRNGSSPEAAGSAGGTTGSGQAGSGQAGSAGEQAVLTFRHDLGRLPPVPGHLRLTVEL